MDASFQVHPGDVLVGKYRVESILGQGGMGVVVAATHLQLEERVAIKFLLPSALQNPDAVARFAREARSAVKIKSEHVARVTDVGTLETGCTYMVMEYLHGCDLGTLVHQKGPLPIHDAVDFILQASEAIAEAHSLGIIHRDLKPANLFHTLRADGSPCIKVLDFGISKVTRLGGSGADFDMTRTSTVMGSPLYMSPEQMTSARDVDVRTDIWALGIILYELLAGQVPFVADTMPQLCAMILQQPAPALRVVRPDAPEALEAALTRCLAKTPGGRFRNMAELATALLPFASRSGRTSVERISRLLNPAGATTAPDLPPTSSERQPSATQAAWGQTAASTKRRAPLIALGVGVLLAAVAGAFFVFRDRPAADSPAEASATVATKPVPQEAPTTNTAPPSGPTIAPTTSPSTAIPVTSARRPTAATNASISAPSHAKPSAPRTPSRSAPHTSPSPGDPVAPPAASKRTPVDLYSDRK